MALGCDYPTGHLVISESIPSRDRGRLVLGAFAFQAVGALVGTALGYAILVSDPQLDAWRWMYAIVIAPATLVVIARLFITDSGQWLMSQGRRLEAERELQRLLEREPHYPKQVRLAEEPDASRLHGAAGAAAGATSCRRRTAVPPSSPPSRGSCRISGPTASASSRPPSLPAPSGTRSIACRTSRA